MTALYSDTHPKMEALQIELIRRMPAWKKISIMDGLNQRMLAELTLGAELARKVYDHAK